ncbi:MAG: hypothetical protein IGS54_31325 [Elainella sp. C42_A2020_010]|nr:hypothetical protein [Elainella sp. C42_A2020_010]RNJ70690.1 MAG: hypothetical protein EDM05_01530 [Leptolyngbya sp. IPPAS B-1204]
MVRVPYSNSSIHQSVALAVALETSVSGRSKLSNSLLETRSSTSRSASSVVDRTIKLTRNMSFQAAAASGAARITVGRMTLFIGTNQVTKLNQDPIVLAYEGSRLKWANTKYETTGADGRGYGLFYNGKQLYAAFSVDGTQGQPNQDFRRVSGGATQPWLRSYGNGGGPKVAVVARLDPANGKLLSAVYLSAINNGKSNSFVVKGMNMSGNNLWVNGLSYFAPRKLDGAPMQQIDQTKKSPFSYNITLTPDLKTALRVSAVGWRV